MRLLAIVVMIAIVVIVVWAVRYFLAARRRSQGWQIRERSDKWGVYEVFLRKPGEEDMVILQLPQREVRTPEGQAKLWEARAEADEAKIVLDNR